MPLLSPKSRCTAFRTRNTPSNKIEIARAVETLFGVKVVKVNTVSVKGRFKRMGRNEGYRPDWKKAIVTLSEDSKAIEFFEGMA